jgi:hypothetical protein
MAVKATDSKRQSQEDRSRQADDLYRRHAKPLEAEHTGEYVAISLEGVVVRASTLQQVLDRSLVELGKGSFVFRLGSDRSVGKWR